MILCVADAFVVVAASSSEDGRERPELSAFFQEVLVISTFPGSLSVSSLANTPPNKWG